MILSCLSLREELEREKSVLEQRIIQYQEEARMAKDALQRSEEAADLLAEKSMIAEQESMLLQQKASEAENEVQRIKLSVIKSEEEKLVMENKAREAENFVSQLVEEAERRKHEARELQHQVVTAREAERLAKGKLMQFLTSAISPQNAAMETDNGILEESYATNGSLDFGAFEMTHANSAIHDVDADLGQLSLEIEKERHEYLEKSKHLNDQLKTLKDEIDKLKVDDKMTTLDVIHTEQQEQGDTKYSTIQKVKRGSATSRVAFFEEL